MPHGPTRIPTKGACIYCGARDVRLTDEHILPLSLGGQHVIEKASCLNCADITKKFEQDVARELWGDARISYNAPSRRKKNRPTHIQLRDPDLPNRVVKVRYSDYPAPFVFYKMGKAGLLAGLHESIDTSSAWQFSTIVDEARANTFQEDFGIKLSAKFRHVPNSFARMLAKIGYGQVLASLDPGEFEPICLPYIIGSKSNLSFIVGGSMDVPPPDVDIGYNLQTISIGDSNRILLVTHLRLYANNHTPVYHVVVGEVSGVQRVQKALDKLGDGTDYITPDIIVSRSSGSLPHWMPVRWPLA